MIACLWLTDDSLDYTEVKQILCGKPESLCRISRLWAVFPENWRTTLGRNFRNLVYSAFVPHLSVGLSITKSLILLSPPYFLSEELTVTATVFLYSSFVFTINTTVSTFGIIISDLNILRTRINICFFTPFVILPCLINTAVGFGNISVRWFVLGSFMKRVNTLNVRFCSFNVHFTFQ